MRILVVDDEKEIREFIKSSLEAECFAVDMTGEGERAAFLAKTNNYDLIILDYMLPKKSGLEVCKALRKEGVTSPIIMLSVQGDAATKVKLLSAGADDYLTKPFSFEELLARVRALLRRPKVLAEETLTIRDLVLDIPRHTVKRAEREIYLTRKEFELLEYLMRNAGLVLSRGMIMEHVWDIQGDAFSNTIETHILNLRVKIDRPSRYKLIRTVPGRGYKIEAK
jgi:DNA-binding response OmpR family regulator